MLKIEDTALTFDDILLIPGYSSVLPKEVSLNSRITKSIAINIPLASAAMDTVTEAKLAIALAQEGGIGILHKNMSAEDQALEVSKVKKYESGVVKDPVTISPNQGIQELQALTKAHNISGVPVTEGKQLLGIVTSRDIRFEDRTDVKVRDIMTAKNRLVTVKEGEEYKAKQLLHSHRIEKVMVVNDSFELKGMITVKDIIKAENHPNSCKDKDGRLRVGAAVGAGPDNTNRVANLIEAGVDLLVVDTAHGHSKGVLDSITAIKKSHPKVEVIGGNIATSEAAKALIDAGVDGIKVGIGPGSICTTRIVAGIGVPQITAISKVAEVAAKQNIPVIADGGIRFSGDIAKAIAAGADVVMIGSLLAGTEEAPGEVELYQGGYFKSYRGMGSLGAMAQVQGSSDRYFQDASKGADKLVPEGIEGRVPYKGPMTSIVSQLMGGLRSSMGYTGSKDINTMKTKTKFVRVTSAGMTESHVHDVTITKEAPNYPIA